MPNIRIITPNDGDTATLSDSPALAATLPVTNLQDVSRARVARTTSTASQDLKGTWSSSKVISACALMRHNLTSGAGWTLRLYSDAAWTTLVYNSGAISALPPKTLGDLDWGVDPLGATVFTNWDQAYSVMWFDAVKARSFTLTITDASNPDGYFQASRLFIGRYLEAVANFDYGNDMGWAEDTTQERTDGGTLRSDGIEPYRRMSFDLSWLDMTDRPKFQEWARRDGKRNDVFISMYPEQGGTTERDACMAAKLVSSPMIAHRYTNAYGGKYVVEEA